MEVKEQGGCRFCHQEEDGGVVLMEAMVDFGDVGNLELEVNLYNYDDNFAPTMCASAYLDTGNRHGLDLNCSTLEVRFCPMCGRKLRGGADE